MSREGGTFPQMLTPFRRLLSTSLTQPKPIPETGGDSTTPLVVVYVSPHLPETRTFFEEVYDHLNDLFSKQGRIRFIVRPIAPEMHSCAAGFSSELRTIGKSSNDDENIRPTLYAECALSIYDSEGIESMLLFLSRLSQIRSEIPLTRNRMHTYANNVGADPESIEQDLSKGTYRIDVRQNTEDWILMRPKTSSPLETCLFIDGQPIEMARDSVTDAIRAASALREEHH